MYDLLFVKQKAPELVHTLTLNIKAGGSLIKAVGRMKVFKAIESLNYCRNIKAGGSLIKAVGRMKSY